jgi:hypothetical protein
MTNERSPSSASRTRCWRSSSAGPQRSCSTSPKPSGRALSDAARARALPWIVAAVRERADAYLPDALVRDLPVELLIERWSSYAGSSVYSICQSPAMIERLGGQSAVDRMAIVESAAQIAAD